MKNVLEFFDRLLKKLGNDFSRTEVPCKDYMDASIPFDRVKLDRDKCLNMIEKYFDLEKDNTQRELVVAMYCNFYIRYGMAGRFERENESEIYDGLEVIFNAIEEKQSNMKELYKAIKFQDYEVFDLILKSNPKSIVAKIYMFVKLCFEYTKEVIRKNQIQVINIDKYEKMWNLYDVLPDSWKKYVLGKGELIKHNCFNPYVADENLLPYMRFVPSFNFEIWNDCQNKNCKFSNMNIALRSSYLHIPVFGGIYEELFLSQYSVFCKNRKLKRSALQKKEMMDYYAHSWKHIAYPQIVKEVAEELSKTNISMANKLMKAYNSEKTLQRGIELLQYTNSNDEKAISRAFKEGMALSGRNSKSVKVLQEVFNESIDLVVFKILMTESDDSNKMKLCREKWNNVTSLDRLREEYISKFLETVNDCNQNEIVQWVNMKMFPITVEIDNVWGDIRFKEDSFALNQFKEILVEIITNAFEHGEKGLSILFSNRDNVLEITAENGCKEMEKSNRKGLSTMSRVLDGINWGTEIKSIEKELKDDIFRIILRLNKEILVRKGR